MLTKVNVNGWESLTEGEFGRFESLAGVDVPGRSGIPAPTLTGVSQRLAALRRRGRIALADRYRSLSDASRALEIARSMLAEDAADEAGSELLIRLALSVGDRPAALAQWASYRETIRRDYGIEPGIELRQLIEGSA